MSRDFYVSDSATLAPWYSSAVLMDADPFVTNGMTCQSPTTGIGAAAITSFAASTDCREITNQYPMIRQSPEVPHLGADWLGIYGASTHGIRDTDHYSLSYHSPTNVLSVERVTLGTAAFTNTAAIFESPTAEIGGAAAAVFAASSLQITHDPAVPHLRGSEVAMHASTNRFQITDHASAIYLCPTMAPTHESGLSMHCVPLTNNEAAMYEPWPQITLADSYGSPSGLGVGPASSFPITLGNTLHMEYSLAASTFRGAEPPNSSILWRELEEMMFTLDDGLATVCSTYATQEQLGWFATYVADLDERIERVELSVRQILASADVAFHAEAGRQLETAWSRAVGKVGPVQVMTTVLKSLRCLVG